jgi:hypothetical protein
MSERNGNASKSTLIPLYPFLRGQVRQAARQAQHQLDAAINGLFESIEDPEPIDNGQAQDAEAASGEVQMGDAAGDSAEDHEVGDAENASNEAGAEQKE